MLTTNNEPGIIVRRAEQLPWLKKEIEHPAVTLEALEELEDMKDKNNPLIFLQNSDRRSTKDTLNKAVLQTGEAELWGDGLIEPPRHNAHKSHTDPQSSQNVMFDNPEKSNIEGVGLRTLKSYKTQGGMTTVLVTAGI